MKCNSIVQMKLKLYFQWHPTLQRIKHLLEESTGLEFNSMLANLYRDGHDSLAWHADNERSLGPDPTIASISLGDSRTFQMRKNPPPVSLYTTVICITVKTSVSVTVIIILTVVR